MTFSPSDEAADTGAKLGLGRALNAIRAIYHNHKKDILLFVTVASYVTLAINAGVSQEVVAFTAYTAIAITHSAKMWQ